MEDVTMFIEREAGIVRALLKRKVADTVDKEVIMKFEGVLSRLESKALTVDDLETVRSLVKAKLKASQWVLEKGKSDKPETLKEYIEGLELVMSKFKE